VATATDQEGSDFLQIARQIGEELLRHPNALRTLGLGVRRIQENVHASIIELKMTADGQGSEAAPPYRPNGDQGQ
jgi:hypothetical protein